MKEVAEKAGVSVMSVSRALRNQRGVSPETRRHILETARDLGYRPNPLVRALMASRRGTRVKESVRTIAFITSHSKPRHWRDYPTPLAFYEGAKERAERLGFRLQDFWLNDEKMPGLRLSQVLWARGIRGAILCPHPHPNSSIELRWEHLAVVALGYSFPKPEFHRATNHQLHTILRAVTELESRGYRSIGLAVETHFDARVDHNWSSGFLGYQHRIPQEYRIPPLISPKLERKCVQEWIKYHRPEAVIGGVPLEWLQETGIPIPEKMGFVRLGYHSSMGDIAAVDQNLEAVGGAATDLVVEQLHRNETGLPKIPKVVMVEGRWQDGWTVGQRLGMGREARKGALEL